MPNSSAFRFICLGVLATLLLAFIAPATAAAVSPDYVTCQTRTYSYTWNWNGTLETQRMRATGCWDALEGIAYGTQNPTITYSSMSISDSYSTWYNDSNGHAIFYVASNHNEWYGFWHFEPFLRLKPNGTWQCFNGSTYEWDIGGYHWPSTYSCSRYS
jgi:hypothetical protein